MTVNHGVVGSSPSWSARKRSPVGQCLRDFSFFHSSKLHPFCSQFHALYRTCTHSFAELTIHHPAKDKKCRAFSIYPGRCPGLIAGGHCRACPTDSPIPQVAAVVFLFYIAPLVGAYNIMLAREPLLMTLCFFISPYFFRQNRRKKGIFGWFLPQKWSRFFIFEKALFCHFSAKIFTTKKLLQKVCQTTLRSKPFKKWAKNPRFVQ